MMKPHVLSRISREVAYGLHELLKTNAANIHCTDDWYTLFSLLECIGAGVKPPASFQLAATTADNDTGLNTTFQLIFANTSDWESDVKNNKKFQKFCDAYNNQTVWNNKINVYL